MKIYTGFGDKGKTRLHGGDEVYKNHPRIEVYGTLDELNSWLGFIIAWESEDYVKNHLLKIQNHIFDISSLIATPDQKKYDKLKTKIGQIDFSFLEKLIDEIDPKLPPLKNFILPGGSKLSAYYHIARTICRRAERKMIPMSESKVLENEILIYFNRLSDLFFVLARFANFNQGVADVLWSSVR